MCLAEYLYYNSMENRNLGIFRSDWVFVIVAQWKSYFYLAFCYLMFNISPFFNIISVGIGLGLIVKILHKILFQLTVKYEFTDDLIIYKHGIFNVKTDFIEMYRIKDYSKYQSLLMRIFGVMNIGIHSSDKSHPILILRYLPNIDILNNLRTLINEGRSKHGVYELD